MNRKAMIAMSGGVDSSVAAFLMKDAGYDCIGATMKLFQNEDIGIPKAHSCCSLDDVEDARSVAYALELLRSFSGRSYGQIRALLRKRNYT